MSSSLEEENAHLRAELKTLRAQFEELLQIAAKQSQELGELRTMLRRKVTGERPPPTSETAPADPEGDTVSPETAPPADGATADPLAGVRPTRNANRKRRSKGAGRRASGASYADPRGRFALRGRRLRALWEHAPARSRSDVGRSKSLGATNESALRMFGAELGDLSGWKEQSAAVRPRSTRRAGSDRPRWRGARRRGRWGPTNRCRRARRPGAGRACRRVA